MQLWFFHKGKQRKMPSGQRENRERSHEYSKEKEVHKIGE